MTVSELIEILNTKIKTCFKEQNMMKNSYYRCPKCYTRTKNMEVLEEKYIPTEEDYKFGPVWKSHPDLASNKLLCKCGAVNTWFTLIECDEDASDAFLVEYLSNHCMHCMPDENSQEILPQNDFEERVCDHLHKKKLLLQLDEMYIGYIFSDYGYIFSDLCTEYDEKFENRKKLLCISHILEKIDENT